MNEKMVAINFNSPPFVLIKFLASGEGSEWLNVACNISQAWMVREPGIYKSGITGVSSLAADTPDRSFCDPDSLSPSGSTHLTFFFPPLDL